MLSRKMFKQYFLLKQLYEIRGLMKFQGLENRGNSLGLASPWCPFKSFQFSYGSALLKVRHVLLLKVFCGIGVENLRCRN